ncbi:uncharacterized protein LOC115736897 [Rhodamnia argentea]|uniref:Uncharacterized protein LOC115736897 n=1 Tax=Rhodamnia argentea TaxID=178133 RepID=A0A8B8NR71_9MYRT|nr:uncharacterized protein LOC115736897 [Rhodamnia argentea]
MGNAYRDHHHLYHLHHGNNLQIQHKSSFLPMLCSRPSIKDGRLPKWNDEDRSASFSDDPMSPKVGCMGQVKRNNRVVGFPTPNKLIAIAAKANVNKSLNKYAKLKRLFSSKSLLTSATAAAAAAASGSYERRRQKESNGCAGAKKKCEEIENSVSSPVSILDMDPPLPVIKKVSKPAAEGGGGDGSLWKRRSGGVALKGLELQQIHHPRHHMQPGTV